MTIEASHYEETQEALRQDSVLLAMVDAIPPGFDVEQIDMIDALNEYHQRGGNVPTHIDGPRQVIAELLSEREEQQ